MRCPKVPVYYFFLYQTVCNSDPQSLPIFFHWGLTICCLVWLLSFQLPSQEKSIQMRSKNSQKWEAKIVTCSSSAIAAIIKHKRSLARHITNPLLCIQILCRKFSKNGLTWLRIQKHKWTASIGRQTTWRILSHVKSTPLL